MSASTESVHTPRSAASAYVIVDTRDAAHAQEVLALLRRSGFPAEQLIDVQPVAS